MSFPNGVQIMFFPWTFL